MLGPPTSHHQDQRHGSSVGRLPCGSNTPDRVHNDSSFLLFQDYCTFADGGCRCPLRLMFVNHRLIAVFGPSSLNRIRIGPACMRAWPPRTIGLNDKPKDCVASIDTSVLIQLWHGISPWPQPNILEQLRAPTTSAQRIGGWGGTSHTCFLRSLSRTLCGVLRSISAGPVPFGIPLHMLRLNIGKTSLVCWYRRACLTRSRISVPQQCPLSHAHAVL